MAQINLLPASTRERSGKGGSRALRRSGQIPGIVYGGKDAPLEIALPLKEMNLEYQKPGFFTHLYDLALPQGALRVLPREVQLDPVTDRPVHVDFMRYVKGSRVAVHVAVHFLDHAKSEGLKNGGVLNIVRHTVELLCPVDAIPDSISVSLAGREIGDSLHISAFKLPDGVTPVIRDRDFTVATIVAPTTMVEEEKPTAEAAAEAAAAEAAAAPGGAEGAKGPGAGAGPGAAKGGEAAKGKAEPAKTAGAAAGAAKGGKAEGGGKGDKK